MNALNAQDGLIAACGFLAGKVRVQREKRLYAEVDYANFAKVFDLAITGLQFTILCTITGLDEGENLAFIYHLADETGTILNLKTSVPKTAGRIRTVMNYFPCAEIYERELVDLLGAKIEDLPAGTRYPLPDDWPAGEYPLRKDWKQGVSFKA